MIKVFDTLKALNACFGPSGCEDEIRKEIAKIAKPYADKIYTDVMGNLIVLKKAATGKTAAKAETPRLMFAAHMDSIGLIVTFIEDSGLLRFGAVGGINDQNLYAMPVRFANGTVGTIGIDAGAEKRTKDKMFIDIGATSKAEAEKLVRCGDMAVYDSPVRMLGKQSIVSPYIDNRAGVVAQLLALSMLKKPVFDCYFVFTVQEEVGCRGARPSSFGIDPQYGIVCDTTLTDDIPNAKHWGTSVLGGGAAIKVMDASVICHPEMVEALTSLAKKNKIPCQNDVIIAGGTDASEMRKNASGVWTGGVSIATRYIHSPQEVCRISDIEDCAKLMAAFAQEKPKF